jgi:hypothetical protein
VPRSRVSSLFPEKSCPSGRSLPLQRARQQRRDPVHRGNRTRNRPLVVAPVGRAGSRTREFARQPFSDFAQGWMQLSGRRDGHCIASRRVHVIYAVAAEYSLEERYFNSFRNNSCQRCSIASTALSCSGRSGASAVCNAASSCSKLRTAR